MSTRMNKRKRTECEIGSFKMLLLLCFEKEKSKEKLNVYTLTMLFTIFNDNTEVCIEKK